MHIFKFDFWEVLNVLNFVFYYKLENISICNQANRKKFCIPYFFLKNSEVLKMISMKI